MIALRPLAAVATCSLALVAAACGGATTGSAPGAAGTAGKGADAFPASTLFFVDANADLESSAWQKVRTVGARFPGYAQVEAKVTKAVGETGKDGLSFATDIQPWAGDEAAFGVLAVTLAGGKPKPQFVAYLASKDDAKATAAITKDGTAKPAGDYKGYATFADADTVIAIGKNAVLVASDTTSLHASVDAREGDASGRLGGSALYSEALGTLPEDNVLVGYADGPKLAQLAGTAFELASSGTEPMMKLPTAQVDKALSQLEALRAIAFSVGADDNGFRFRASTLLDAAKTKQLETVTSSQLTLLDRAPADALLYAGSPGLGDGIGTTINDLTASNPQVAQGIAGVEAMTGLSVANDIVPLLSGELGLYVSGGAPAKGALLLKPKDAAAGAASLTKITAAVAKQGGEKAPTFAPLPAGEGQIATVDGHDLSWLHDGELIAIGFDTAGVAPAGGLGGSDRFRSARDAAKVPDKVAALLYADVQGLVTLAQRTRGDAVPADAVANIRALGGVLAWSTQDGGIGKSELYVQVPSTG